MKITLLFFLACLLNVNAGISLAQDQKVSVTVENGSLNEVFEQIEGQTSFRFFYNSTEVDSQAEVNAVYEDTKLSKVLTAVLESQDLSFSVFNKQIILRKNALPIKNSILPELVQMDTIRGVVTTQQGVPLSGVSVIIEGTDRGTVTNFDGEYTLPLKDEDGTASLEDFQGSYVLIDVWATWCVPCIYEMPFMKEVEEEYEGKNIKFIGLSLDNPKDEEKWRKMIVDKELDDGRSVQLLADNAMKSQFAQDYYITGIPRYILLDPKGQIISYDAPRPSEPKLREMLDELEM